MNFGHCVHFIFVEIHYAQSFLLAKLLHTLYWNRELSTYLAHRVYEGMVPMTCTEWVCSRRLHWVQLKVLQTLLHVWKVGIQDAKLLRQHWLWRNSVPGKISCEHTLCMFKTFVYPKTAGETHIILWLQTTSQLFDTNTRFTKRISCAHYTRTLR